MAAQTHEEILKTFRETLFAEGILHEGDTIGTDDETLLCVFDCETKVSCLNISRRRFLRARKFNLAQAKTMMVNAQNWRKTVNGTGLDKLYSEMDPFDVRLSLSIHYSCGEVQSRVVQYPEREAVFDCWPLYFHKTDKVGSNCVHKRTVRNAYRNRQAVL
jgi:hypothetical protein